MEQDEEGAVEEGKRDGGNKLVPTFQESNAVFEFEKVNSMPIQGQPAQFIKQEGEYQPDELQKVQLIKQEVKHQSDDEKIVKSTDLGVEHLSDDERFVKHIEQEVQNQSDEERFVKHIEQDVQNQSDEERLIEPIGQGVEHQSEDERFVKHIEQEVQNQSDEERFVKHIEQDVQNQSDEERLIEPIGQGVEHQSEGEGERLVKHIEQVAENLTGEEGLVESIGKGVEHKSKEERLVEPSEQGVEPQCDEERLIEPLEQEVEHQSDDERLIEQGVEDRFDEDVMINNTEQVKPVFEKDKLKQKATASTRSSGDVEEVEIKQEFQLVESEFQLGLEAKKVDPPIKKTKLKTPVQNENNQKKNVLECKLKGESCVSSSTKTLATIKPHHSSQSSWRRSSDHRHSSRCASRKKGGHCDCSRRHKSDSHRHSSHSHSHSQSRSHRQKRINERLQVNLAELHHHCMKQKSPTSMVESSKWVPPRVPWSPHETILRFKYQELFRVETDPNGGATVCHLYYDEVSHLPKETIQEIATEFIMLSYSEDEDENAHHVIGIVHGGAHYLPDLLDYMADHYASITVKVGSLTGRGTQTINMGEYRNEVYKSYSNGTFRFAPLQELSICGVQGEEVGAYFPDFVKRLEQSPHMFSVMPWRSLSVVATDNPRESNDGPIFWIRPGEQTLPSSAATRSKGRLAKGVSRLSEAREALFEDRTKPHADQIGIDGGTTDTAPTAAVGLLKAVNCGNKDHGGRATKDVVAFHAQDYHTLLDLLSIDVYEPPLRQCTMWLETAKLNSLRRQGIRFARMQLHDGDVYYLPRKIIHQFQTISAVASVAWHVRFVEYFKKTGAPNLHAPTGLNKGAVYYEKKVVPPYNPPKPVELEEDLIVIKNSRKRHRCRSEGEMKTNHKDSDNGKMKKNEKDKAHPSTTTKLPKARTTPGGASRAPSSCLTEGEIRTGQKDNENGKVKRNDKEKIHPSTAAKLPKARGPPSCPASARHQVLQPLASSRPHHSTGSTASDHTGRGVVSPIKLEKAPGTKNFAVVPKVPASEEHTHERSNVTATVTPEKPLKENIQFKKRKADKITDKFDVVGDIISQMKKARGK